MENVLIPPLLYHRITTLVKCLTLMLVPSITLILTTASTCIVHFIHFHRHSSVDHVLLGYKIIIKDTFVFA